MLLEDVDVFNQWTLVPQTVLAQYFILHGTPSLGKQPSTLNDVYLVPLISLRLTGIFQQVLGGCPVSFIQMPRMHRYRACIIYLCGNFFKLDTNLVKILRKKHCDFGFSLVCRIASASKWGLCAHMANCWTSAASATITRTEKGQDHRNSAKKGHGHMLRSRTRCQEGEGHRRSRSQMLYFTFV